MSLEMKEEIKILMIKRGLLLGIIFSAFGIAISAYGMESEISTKGNIKGMEEQILCLKEDFVYLQEEIQSLLEECN